MAGERQQAVISAGLSCLVSMKCVITTKLQDIITFMRLRLQNCRPHQHASQDDIYLLSCQQFAAQFRAPSDALQVAAIQLPQPKALSFASKALSHKDAHDAARLDGEVRKLKQEGEHVPHFCCHAGLLCALLPTSLVTVVPQGSCQYTKTLQGWCRVCATDNDNCTS